MAPCITFFLFSMLLLVLGASKIHGSQGVIYSVTNRAEATPGGARFAIQIGVTYSLQTLPSATDFVWNILQLNNPEDRKSVEKVALFIDDINGVAYTNLTTYDIHVSAKYLAAYQGNLKTEFTGVIYHEMTHVWQWYGNDQAPAPDGLTEGIADFVRLRAGYVPGYWVGPGEGDRWDKGYDVTARFLEYLESLSPGFVAQLNMRIRYAYSEQYFVELLGRTVDQLWEDYKATYNYK